MAEYKLVKVSRSPGVLRIAIDHPPVNVLNMATMTEISQALASADQSVKVVVLSGQGRCFSAGVDVSEHVRANIDKMLPAFHAMFRKMAAMPQITVASVHGSTLGGACELAIFCDLVVAAESAKFGQPEVKLASFPPLSIILLPRIIGRKKALELLLTGDTIDAREAERLGLVNRVVPDDQLETATNALVSKLSAYSGPVLALTKKALRQAVDTDFGPVLDKVEAIYIKELAQLHDSEEGLRSFMEKRPPVWQER